MSCGQKDRLCACAAAADISHGRSWCGGAMYPKGTCSASLHCVGIAPYETIIDRPYVGADAYIRPHV